MWQHLCLKKNKVNEIYMMINFQVPQIYHKQKNIHESVNHSKSKALPVLQTDLHLEEEEGRALWFKSEARMNSAAKFCALLTLWA